MKSKKIIANIGIFEAHYIWWVDSLVPDTIKDPPRVLALKIECQACPGQKLFAAIERNRNGSYHALFKKKVHNEVNRVANYLPAQF